MDEKQLPLEVQLPYLSVAVYESFTNESNVELQYAELKIIDEIEYAPTKLGALMAMDVNAFNNAFGFVSCVKAI